jgi:hypothetical protein
MQNTFTLLVLQKILDFFPIAAHIKFRPQCSETMDREVLICANMNLDITIMFHDIFDIFCIAIYVNC